jgi:hypothetical protein
MLCYAMLCYVGELNDGFTCRFPHCFPDSVAKVLPH